MNAFSKNLIELRKLNKLTQRDVARHLGISQPSYTRYENGKSEPTIENLIKLADLFDVSIDYLCGRVSY
ncbi:MAG: helix-turn-helix domain-containing protein [Christensenellales bacterium]